MQQGSGNPIGINAHICQEQRNFQRMLDIRLTRAAQRAHMRYFRQFVGTLNPLHILWSEILAGLRQEILQCAPLWRRGRHMPWRQRLFWIDGHHWITSIDDTYG